MPENQRKVYDKVLVKSFISGEESSVEDNDGASINVLCVKPLPWRGGKVNRFFRKLDDRAKTKQKQSKQATQQTLPRVTGELSTRPKPVGFPDDFWAFTER